ncbi:MAG: bifunctional nuclease family protein [Syntrophales bacterium]|jgi:bifunctional DNase/RNase|nr:bifunctional nuclease family protein [Syntrophales bacterium]MCK9528087.1 bifunctional nuclease family protein [Syntrophales bacterium]MDX9922317.1 bifunctional nuclease family protein [Syntrophales bacterium]
MLVEMKVFGLAIDPVAGAPIVILKDRDGKRAVPIWIGIFEASAIATQLEKIDLSRPMTHDLLLNAITSLRARITRIVINDLKNNTFFATIHLEQNGAELLIDSRPSDAIAVALRASAPIFVDETVVEKSMDVHFTKQTGDLKKYTKEELREFLENLAPEDFGKYKM